MNKKILLILFVALIVRLYHIMFPVTGWHSWRQADTAAIARNYYASGNSILYPQIDWGGNTPGFVESEFHVYPYLVSILYGLFGVHDYFGRMLSVVFSIFSVFGLYLIVRKAISESVALWAAFIFAILPLNIYFTRVFMPESLMLMCSIYGIYFFLIWIDEGKPMNYLLSLFFISTACLIKLPTLYIGLPLAFIAFQKYGWKMFLKPKIIFFVIVVFLITGLWYYQAHQLFKITGLTFSIWNFGEDKWGMTDLLFKPGFYNDIFIRGIGERHLTYAGFVILIWGLFLKRNTKFEKLFDFYLIAVIIFILIAPQAHIAQEYYQLPFNIPASVFIAKIFSRYIKPENFKDLFRKNKFACSIALTGFVFILLLSFLRVQHFMKSEDLNAPLFRLTKEVKGVVPENDLIITVSSENPVFLYHSERKGWTTYPAAINEKYISKLKDDGAKYLISEKSEFREHINELDFLLSNYQIVSNTGDYFIVKL